MVEILTVALSLLIFKDICKALWCHRVGRKCETKFMPAAEGSACGPDMVIKHVFCTCVCVCFVIHLQVFYPVDGLRTLPKRDF